MNIRNMLIGCALAVCASSAQAVEWANVDAGHYLAGRRCSNGYLQGKVVLVDRWGAHCPPCRALLPRLEDVWQSYRTKPFVLLGGHCEGWGTAEEVKRLAADAKLTYPIYEGACLAKNEPSFNGIPFLYVVDETGRLWYKGHNGRDATQAIVEALTDWASPKNLAAWKRYLDYEIAELPGRAYLRLTAFQKEKEYAEEAKAYAETYKALKAKPEVVKLSALVAFAQSAKDAKPFTEKQKVEKNRFVRSLKDAKSKYASLKNSKDEKIVREAKNALADIAWTEASL